MSSKRRILSKTSIDSLEKCRIRTPEVQVINSGHSTHQLLKALSDYSASRVYKYVFFAKKNVIKIHAVNSQFEQISPCNVSCLRKERKSILSCSQVLIVESASNGVLSCPILATARLRKIRVEKK